MLLVAALLGAVALRHTLALEVADVRLDGAVILTLAFVRDTNVGAAGLTCIAIGSAIDAAHRRVVFGATASLAHAFVQRASQDAFLADPAHRTIEVTVADAILRDALAGLADVPRSTIDQRAQVHTDAGRHWLGDTRVHAVDRPAVERLTIVPWGAIAIVVALARLREVLQAFDELVRRSETTLSVLLPLTRGLLVALVDGTPLACARDVHPLLYAKVIAAARAHASVPGRLFTVTLVPNTNAAARGLARVDVGAAVPPAHGLEDAGAIASSWARDAPVCVRPRHARVADEAILRRPAMHGLVTATPVSDVVLATGSFLD